MYYGLNPLVPTLIVLTMTIGPILVWRIALWIARPLDIAAKNRKHPTQFTIVDFLCLFFLIQWPTALIHSLPTSNVNIINRYFPFVLDAYAWASMGVIWWKFAEIMSRAGINTPVHRIILLVLVLPVVFAGPLLPFVFFIVVAIGMVKFTSTFWLVFTIICIILCTPIAMILCARLVRRIVAASDAVLETPVELVETDTEEC